MNWEAIKNIYRSVLVHNHKIEYLGGDKYKLISLHPTVKKWWEEEYQNGLRHGKDIGWHINGQKIWETEYQNGQLHGKDTRWDESGKKLWEHDYQNGKRIT